ncbi:MAG: hypothetical protein ACI3Y4_05610, partial [Candidatus Cryptobacteroides sp.]
LTIRHLQNRPPRGEFPEAHSPKVLAVNISKLPLVKYPKALVVKFLLPRTFPASSVTSGRWK